MIYYRCQGHKPFGDTVDQAVIEDNQVKLASGFQATDDDSFSFVHTVVSLPGVRMFTGICVYELPFVGRPITSGEKVEAAGKQIRRAHGLRR